MLAERLYSPKIGRLSEIRRSGRGNPHPVSTGKCRGKGIELRHGLGMGRSPALCARPHKEAGPAMEPAK